MTLDVPSKIRPLCLKWKKECVGSLFWFAIIVFIFLIRKSSSYNIDYSLGKNMKLCCASFTVQVKSSSKIREEK